MNSGSTLKCGSWTLAGLLDASQVLKHEKIAQERLWTIEICLLSEGCPEVERATHGFFSSVVEIVAERRTDLRLGLYGCNQYSPLNNEEIPFFGGSEETGQVNGFLLENVLFRQACLNYQVCKKRDNSIHLSPTGHGTAQALIRFASLLLFLPLRGSGLPVLGNGSLRQFR